MLPRMHGKIQTICENERPNIDVRPWFKLSMIMKPLFITLIFIACSTALFAQKVEVLNATAQLSNRIDTILIGNSIETAKYKRAQPWQLLDSGAGTKNLTFLATIKITGGQKPEKFDFYIVAENIDDWTPGVDWVPGFSGPQDDFAFMDGEIDRLADKWGANVLMLKEFYYDEKARRFSFTLDAFKAADSAYAAICAKKEKNVIYIFPTYEADWQWEKWVKYFRYRINHNKLLKIGRHQYLKYSVGINEEVRVNREGYNPDYIKWEPNKPPVYIVRYGGVYRFTISPNFIVNPTPRTITYREGFGELLRKTIYRNDFVILGANNKFTLPAKANRKGKQ